MNGNIVSYKIDPADGIVKSNTVLKTFDFYKNLLYNIYVRRKDGIKNERPQ